MTKPFLFLQLRPEDEAADNEMEAFLKFGKLSREDIQRIRIDKEDLIDVDLDKYSGIIIGGGPSNVSDSEDKKSDNQKKFEVQLNTLLKNVIEKDFPFLGTCYGIGLLVKYLGGRVSKEKYSEGVGAVELSKTEEGKIDNLTKDLPTTFKAFAGHKEACQNISDDTVLLLSSKTCPIQMVRHKNNIYATQFHTELDQQGLELRINIYKHAGYFPPEDADMLIAESKHEVITEPEKILRNFINIYGN